jgi:AcrR family transcriptional regulator
MWPTMGRPARFDADQLLDVALALAWEGGPDAVTMASVAQRAGAPSGSLYHRFPSRAALQSALWLRCVARFQDEYLAALSHPNPRSAASDAARSVIAFSRAHPQEALVLLHGAREFGAEGWSPEARAAVRDHAAAIETAIRTLAARLQLRGVDGIERATLAIVDLPYAIVRRHLRAGRPVPPRAAQQAADAAAAILNT